MKVASGIPFRPPGCSEWQSVRRKSRLNVPFFLSQNDRHAVAVAAGMGRMKALLFGERIAIASEPRTLGRFRSITIESSHAVIELAIDIKIVLRNRAWDSGSGCLDAKNFFKIDEREVRIGAFLLHPFKACLNQFRRQFAFANFGHQISDKLSFLVTTSFQNRVKTWKACRSE